jgi:hypothetical protein
VPPTKGTLLGTAASDLKVRVRVTPAGAVLTPEPGYPSFEDKTFSQVLKPDDSAGRVQAMQQQQQ